MVTIAVNRLIYYNDGGNLRSGNLRSGNYRSGNLRREGLQSRALALS